MSKNTYGRRRLSDAERDQRRTAERERAKQAAEQLLTSDGWQRWVRARSMFHRYSANNCMLIALEFHLRGMEPEPVAGFRTWLKLGRYVRKGEHGIRIAARVAARKAEPTVESRDEHADDGDRERRVRFTTVAVFDTLSRVWPRWRQKCPLSGYPVMLMLLLAGWRGARPRGTADPRSGA
jgi:hypothetical protein